VAALRRRRSRALTGTKFRPRSSIAPHLVTLRESIDAAHRAARWDALARVLARFGLALGEALAALLDHGLCLDPSPANFAVQGGRVRYIDDDVARSRDATGIEDAFTGRFGEYAGVPAEVWDGYAARFVRELALRVSPDDRMRRVQCTSSVCSAPWRS
jgi:hypothetical protein